MQTEINAFTDKQPPLTSTQRHTNSQLTSAQLRTEPEQRGNKQITNPILTSSGHDLLFVYFHHMDER